MSLPEKLPRASRLAARDIDAFGLPSFEAKLGSSAERELTPNLDARSRGSEFDTAFRLLAYDIDDTTSLLVRDLDRLMGVLDRVAPLQYAASGPKLKMLIGALEIGKISGLRLMNGLLLNQSVGGIGTVMNDTWSSKAPLLRERGIETIAVTPLMRNISKDQMVYLGSVRIWLENKPVETRVYQYLIEGAGQIIFVENTLFTRHFNAISDQGQSLYDMREISPGPEGELQKQRVWSALSQAIAGVYALIHADFYVPQDGHMAPASFYIHRQTKNYLSLAPLIHNERYLDHFHVQPEDRERTAAIWNISESDLQEFFMHGDFLTLLAPAIRTAERSGVFTGKSVADHTAAIINEFGLPAAAFPPIEVFSRLASEQNFLADSHRPDQNPFLAQASRRDLLVEGIKDEETIQIFAGPLGFQFGNDIRSGRLDVNAGKARAKNAVQRMFGLTRDLNRPLFVCFARMVEQKGMDFVVPNILPILKQGGQIIVGGPVGDALGAWTQQALRELKDRLSIDHPEFSQNFVLIDGPVIARKKALLLAGHDFFLLPSRYEPCGLTDIESVYNGGLPIAPRIGGLVKAKSTIKYVTNDVNDQSIDLGRAIAKALRLFRHHPARFQKLQVAAAQEIFSVQKHVGQVLENLRIEVYYRLIETCGEIVREAKITTDQVKTLIHDSILTSSFNDQELLKISLCRMHPHRRSPLIEWVIGQLP